MIEIRRLRFDDASAAISISEIEKNTFSSPLSEASVKEIIASDAYELWSLFNDSELCGYVVAAIAADEAHILSLASKYKRKGYAFSLLKRTVEEFRSQNISCIFLEVRKSNTPAVALYEKIGFICDGCRKNIYDNPVEDGYMMHLRLKDTDFSYGNKQEDLQSGKKRS